MRLFLENLYPTDKNVINFIFAFFPLSFIAGNLIINLNLILLVVCSIIFYKKELFQIKLKTLDKLLFIFFSIILFTGFYNNIEFFLNKNFPFVGYNEIDSYNTIIKSILFLRYLLLYLTLRYLIENNIIDLKFIFASSTFCTLFVCFDIFFQFVFSKDIFGYEILDSGRRLSGPFGDEFIAGGYLQRFSLFAFFIFSIFKISKIEKFSNYILLVFFVVISLGLFLSGNRMPIILFFFSIILILFTLKSLRRLILPLILIISLNFSLILYFNKEARTNFAQLNYEVSNMFIILINKDFKNEKVGIRPPLYLKEFVSFYDTWIMNKYIGGGIKNFRYYCHIRPNKDRIYDHTCNMHPHNYYLEILTETGIAGFVIIVIIFLLTLYRTYFEKLILKKSNYKINNLILPFIFLFLVEVFPIRSSGSFFTTNNAAYFFIILSALVALTRKDDLIENRK